MPAKARPAYPDTAAGALALVHDLAREDLVEIVDRGLAAGDLRWTPDPDHRDVWGLQRAGESGLRAIAVVYVREADLEIDEGLLLQYADE